MRTTAILGVLLPLISGCLVADQPHADPLGATHGPPGSCSPASACAAWATAQDSLTRVYFVNGADPFGWAGLDRLAERVRCAGYPHTRYGEVYDIGSFEREIRGVHASDPAARFALVGFSVGTLVVREAVDRLTRDGIPVVLLGYIGGDYLTDSESSRPAGIGQVVNVTGNGYLVTGRNLLWNGADLTGATNARLAGVSHFGLPTHPQTLALLLAALGKVSNGP